MYQLTLTLYFSYHSVSTSNILVFSNFAIIIAITITIVIIIIIIRIVKMTNFIIANSLDFIMNYDFIKPHIYLILIIIIMLEFIIIIKVRLITLIRSI